ncbi:MAG TPA: hypothetical protein VGC74_03710 [Stenotrophomonas sp.]|jgi:hypothetical protein
MKTSATDSDPVSALQRQRARRTAWSVAAVAILIYGAFILSGVLAH